MRSPLSSGQMTCRRSGDWVGEGLCSSSSREKLLVLEFEYMFVKSWVLDVLIFL